MMPRESNKKEDEAHAEEKNVRKKGKAMVVSGTVGMGQQEQSSDSGDPDLDIDRAMVMEAKPLKFDKSAHPASIHW